MESVTESEKSDEHIRQRRADNETTKEQSNVDGKSEHIISSEDDDDDPQQYERHIEKRLTRLKNVLPQASNRLGYYLDSLLQNLPERWVTIKFVGVIIYLGGGTGWSEEFFLYLVLNIPLIVNGLFIQIIMLAGFYFIVQMGITALMLAVLNTFYGN